MLSWLSACQPIDWTIKDCLVSDVFLTGSANCSYAVPCTDRSRARRIQCKTSSSWASRTSCSFCRCTTRSSSHVDWWTVSSIQWELHTHCSLSSFFRNVCVSFNSSFVSGICLVAKSQFNSSVVCSWFMPMSCVSFAELLEFCQWIIVSAKRNIFARSFGFLKL